MDRIRRPERGSDQIRVVPRCRTSEGFAVEAGCVDGIAIDALDTGTRFIVQTRNSEYRLIVLDGPRQTMLMQGGRLLTEATEVFVQGSSAGGSYVKTGWIGVGLRVEILAGGRRIVTSRVQSITIESVPPRPSGSRISA